MSLVQYIVVRGDLGWPIGALIAQGCHASISVIVKHLEDKHTKEYISNLDTMRKVVLKCESEQQLNDLCENLEKEKINFVVWNEMPENIRTCLATVPRDRSAFKSIFRHLKLFE